MHPLKNKYKIYLYLFFFISLTSILNFKILENLKDRLTIKKIEIYGLSNNEKKMVKNEIDYFKKSNIFNLKKDVVLKTLEQFNFLEKIYISKILPSTINVKLSKTQIIGQTLINGEMFYIGKNEKFINSNLFKETNNIPLVFGEFEIEKYKFLQNILADHQVDLKKIEKYYFYKNRRWDISFSSGLTLMLPHKNVEKSIKIYKDLSDEDKLLNTKIVDLRVSNQIILTDFNE